MLKLLSSENQVLQIDDFYILEKSNGLDELVFNISIYDENYPYILEEAIVEYEQPYLIKAIDGGSEIAKVKCQLDLDELKADMRIGYSNNSSNLAVTVNGVLPAGWVFIDNSGSTISRTVEGDYTPYEIIAACAETYDVVFRFKPKERQVFAYNLASFKPLGAFASRELNLKEINYKGKSTDFFTRLYAYGEDGLSFADINDGKEYVENFDYTDKIISAVLRDERYTTKDGLLEAAKKAVKTGGMPTCSYECTVYDLAATNPEMYSFQDFSLFSVVKLIDDIKKSSVNHQVVEYKRYPNYPEKNVVTLSTTATKLQNTLKNLKNEIENPQSAFRVLMQNTINQIAASIAGYDGGNMIITKNADGKPNGIMIMDTESQATAKHVLWFNLNGITYSSEGVNGPYNSVWSFEQGGFIADWIIVGTMLADRIKGGTLTLGGADNGNGVCVVNNADGKEVVRLERTGIIINGGVIDIEKASLFEAIKLRCPNTLAGYGDYIFLLSPNAMTFEQDGSYYSTLGYRTLRFYDSSDTKISEIGVSGVWTSGSLTCTGTKSRAVETENYGGILEYCYEMTSPVFGDIGTGKIGEDGFCYVYLDPVFLEAVSTSCEYQVFLQKEGAGDLWVAGKNIDHFIVEGTSNLSFSWEVKVKQRGYELLRQESTEQIEAEDDIDYATMWAKEIANYEAEVTNYGN